MAGVEMPMMKKIPALIASAAALCLAGPASAQTPTKASARPIRHLILISVDGLMPNTYLEPDAHGLKVPTLRGIVEHGAYSPGVRTVFPAMTYPAHATMVTGVNPGTHGITSNLAWDPLGKNGRGLRWYAQDIRVPTLWQLARARGLRTALVSWPVAVGAVATAQVPEYWAASTSEDIKLMRVLATPRGILDEVARRFPNFPVLYTTRGTPDEALTDVAVSLIETRRPHLVLLHIYQVDHWQHEKGLSSPEANAAIENADHQIARVIEAGQRAGVWKETALVVVSDHGFAPISQRVRPGVLLRENGLITLDESGGVGEWKAVVVAEGGSAFLYVKDKNDEKTRDLLLKTFLPLAGQPKSGIGRVFTHEQIAELGGDPEAFLALEGAPGFGMAPEYTGDYIFPSTQLATHGYAPDRVDMQSSLLVYGPPIGTGEIDHARLIDLAPTLAAWLGLHLPKAQGVRLDIPLPK
jgi:predicted AlkP superfamily pyrophosphatase or phosphodiesterase